MLYESLIAKQKETFNRTTMELKRVFVFWQFYTFFPFNRTTMELKQATSVYDSLQMISFNRTTMELKQGYDVSSDSDYYAF